MRASAVLWMRACDTYDRSQFLVHVTLKPCCMQGNIFTCPANGFPLAAPLLPGRLDGLTCYAASSPNAVRNPMPFRDLGQGCMRAAEVLGVYARALACSNP